ncbi:hypothetical protein ACS0TY_000168 [Phlomoides rotata]
MVAAVTSISSYPSSSSLYHKFHPLCPLACRLNSSIESTSSCYGSKGIKLSSGGENLSIYRPLRIRNAATKQARTPAEEDWKIKRQVLLEKKVRSVEPKEALRLQKENNFVILDVRPEAEFKEVSDNKMQTLTHFRGLKTDAESSSSVPHSSMVSLCRLIQQVLLMCKYTGL